MYHIKHIYYYTTFWRKLEFVLCFNGLAPIRPKNVSLSIEQYQQYNINWFRPMTIARQRIK